MDLDKDTPKGHDLAEMRNRLRHIWGLKILDPGVKLTETAARTVQAEADQLDRLTFGSHLHDLPASRSQ